MSGLPIRDATRFLRLARQQYRLGPRPSPAREQTERDGPPPILTAARQGFCQRSDGTGNGTTGRVSHQVSHLSELPAP